MDMPWITWERAATRCPRLVRAPASMYFDNVPFRKQRSYDPEDYRCKHPAHWVFTVPDDLAKSPWNSLQSGTYCWSHLWTVLNSMDMEKRVSEFCMEWWANNG